MWRRVLLSIGTGTNVSVEPSVSIFLEKGAVESSQRLVVIYKTIRHRNTRVRDVNIHRHLPEDGGDKILRNVGGLTYLPDSTYHTPERHNITIYLFGCFPPFKLVYVYVCKCILPLAFHLLVLGNDTKILQIRSFSWKTNKLSLLNKVTNTLNVSYWLDILFLLRMDWAN
jgi:hypothetical protein